MRRRIREWADDLQLLNDGPGPTVRDDHGKRVWMTGTYMDEINVHAVDVGRELRQGVQFRFHVAPVVAAAPVPDELLQLGQLRTLRRISDGLLVRPSRGGNTRAKIDKHGFGNLNLERPDCAVTCS